MNEEYKKILEKFLKSNKPYSLAKGLAEENKISFYPPIDTPKGQEHFNFVKDVDPKTVIANHIFWSFYLLKLDNEKTILIPNAISNAIEASKKETKIYDPRGTTYFLLTHSQQQIISHLKEEQFVYAEEQRKIFKKLISVLGELHDLKDKKALAGINRLLLNLENMAASDIESSVLSPLITLQKKYLPKKSNNHTRFLELTRDIKEPLDNLRSLNAVFGKFYDTNLTLPPLNISLPPGEKGELFTQKEKTTITEKLSLVNRWLGISASFSNQQGTNTLENIIRQWLYLMNIPLLLKLRLTCLYGV